MKNLRKKFLWSIAVVLIGVPVFMAMTLVYPGWTTTPFRSLIEQRIEREINGLEVRLGTGRLQLRGWRELTVSLTGMRLGAAGKVQLELDRALIRISLGRLMQRRVMPEEILVAGLTVWAEADADGRLLVPDWLSGLLLEEKQEPTPPVEPLDWTELRLGNLPGMLKMAAGEQMVIAMERYTAHLQRAGETHSFVLPSLYVLFAGTPVGVDLQWRSVGWEAQSGELVRGNMQVNVLEERIGWQNTLRLPLTPGLAAWLRGGFPYLPVPGFLQTELVFSSGGEMDLVATRMDVTGQLLLQAGMIVLQANEPLSLRIPELRCDFSSEMSLHDGQPRIRSSVAVAIGEGSSDASIRMDAQVDGAGDTLAFETTGALKNLESLLGLLPEQWRPLGIRGALNWNVELDTPFSEPTAVRRGVIELSTRDLVIAMPGGTGDLRIGNFDFSGSVLQGGDIIQIRPFVLTAGPLMIEGSGMDWQAGADGQTGSGTLRIAPVAVAELLDMVPPGLLELEAGVEAQLRQLRLVDTRLAVEIGGLSTGRLPFGWVRMEPSWRWEMEPHWIAGRAVSMVELHADERISLRCDAQIEGDLLTAQLSGGLQPFRAVDLATATWAGDFQWAFKPAPTEVLLALLPVEPLQATGLSLAELAEFGLDSFTGGLRFVATGLATSPQIHWQDLHGAVKLQMGRSVLQVDFADAPAGENVRGLEWRMQPWNPALSGLSAARLLPVPLEALHLPIAASGSMLLPDPIRVDTIAAALENLETELEWRIEGGYLDAHDLLRKRLPIERIAGKLILRPLSMEMPQLQLDIACNGLRLALHGESIGLADPLSGSLRIAIERLYPGNFLAYVPLQMVPQGALDYWDGLKISGGMDAAEVVLQLGAAESPGADALLPDLLQSLTYELAGGPLVVSLDHWPSLRLSAFSVSGDLDAIGMRMERAGVDAAAVEDLQLRVTRPLAADPEIALATRFVLRLNQLEQLLADFGHAELLPLALLADSASLDLAGHLNASGSMATAFSGDFSVALASLRWQDLLSGGLAASGSYRADPGGALNLRMDFDLRELHTSIAGLSANKQAGESASAQITLAVSGLLEQESQPQLRFGTQLRGLFFDQLNVALDAGFAKDFSGQLAGLQTARVDFTGMDYSDVTVQVDARAPELIDVVLHSRRINFGPLIRLVEPLVLELLAASDSTEADAPGTAAAESAAAASAAGPPVAAGHPPATAGHPPIRLRMAMEELQFGNLQQFGPLRIGGRFSDAFVDELELELGDGTERLQLGIDPLGEQRGFRIYVSNLGQWIASCIRPLQLLQSPAAAANPTLAQLQTLPGYVDQGILSINGQFQLKPDWAVHVDAMSLMGLRLRTEIPFLSRIAELVNRRLILEIPFREFSFGPIDANPSAVEARDIFMDGPINLSFERIRADLASGSVHIEGKVFGVAYEVLGVPPDLQFFLKERSPVIRTITAEDDFDW